MTAELCVLMNGQNAGTLTRLTGGQLRLDYAEDYRADPTATPLSVNLPLTLRTHSDHTITPWLWGLLPDNARVLDRWSRQFQIAMNPFAFLGTPIGLDCAGAVQFAEPGHLDQPQRSNSVARLTTVEVASMIRGLRADNSSWLGTDFAGSFSLAGAQAKTALLWHRGHWGVPRGTRATSHIFKPAVVGLEHHDLNEHLCLRAAQFLGLPSVLSRLMTFEDQTALVVQRYDRTLGGGVAERIHQEDLAQALGFHPDHKYESDGGPSSAAVVALLRASMNPETAGNAVWRFFDALVFNWLIAGTDGHAKNYSLLLSGSDVQLAPLYDIASVLPYRQISLKKARLAMKFGGYYNVDHAQSKLWDKVARELSLNSTELRDRARHLTERIAAAFSEAARDPDIQALPSELPSKLVDAVAQRASICLRSLN